LWSSDSGSYQPGLSWFLLKITLIAPSFGEQKRTLGEVEGWRDGLGAA
jgi:hypothetical protein